MKRACGHCGVCLIVRIERVVPETERESPAATNATAVMATSSGAVTYLNTLMKVNGFTTRDRPTTELLALVNGSECRLQLCRNRAREKASRRLSPAHDYCRNREPMTTMGPNCA